MCNNPVMWSRIVAKLAFKVVVIEFIQHLDISKKLDPLLIHVNFPFKVKEQLKRRNKMDQIDE